MKQPGHPSNVKERRSRTKGPSNLRDATYVPDEKTDVNAFSTRNPNEPAVSELELLAALKEHLPAITRSVREQRDALLVAGQPKEAQAQASLMKAWEMVAAAIHRRKPFVTTMDDLRNGGWGPLEHAIVAFVDPATYSSPSPKTELKEEGAVNALEKFFLEEKLPRAVWSETTLEIRRIVRRNRAKATTPVMWLDKDKPPHLVDASAAKFLKIVWKDFIDEDGTVIKEDIRGKDSALMDAVDSYLKNRRKRNVRPNKSVDYGDAEGLQFVSRPGPPQIEPKPPKKLTR